MPDYMKDAKRTIRDILRQRWVLGCAHRAVARSAGRSVGAVHDTERRARTACVHWTQVEGLTDAAP